MVLVGVHPTLTQVPPTYSRSTTAVRRPAPPRSRASCFPAWPVPRTIASKRSGSMIKPRQQRRVVRLSRYLPAGICFSSYAPIAEDERRSRQRREEACTKQEAKNTVNGTVRASGVGDTSELKRGDGWSLSEPGDLRLMWRRDRPLP